MRDVGDDVSDGGLKWSNERREWKMRFALEAGLLDDLTSDADRGRQIFCRLWGGSGRPPWLLPGVVLSPCHCSGIGHGPNGFIAQIIRQPQRLRSSKLTQQQSPGTTRRPGAKDPSLPHRIVWSITHPSHSPPPNRQHTCARRTTSATNFLKGDEWDVSCRRDWQVDCS